MQTWISWHRAFAAWQNSRVHLPVSVDVLCGFSQVPIRERGRNYLRPKTGTYESTLRNAFNAPQSGRTSSAAFLFSKFSTFRIGQQPTLREIV